ncbi:hypothetical protein [Actinoplanes regularis]|uniref:Uncharacterized protein n=1 Tax=Actinoplanes regularis TaxID=52697 RepID=A0A239FK46_9ACTN|nr:hypothetical protein [Actinoplanes regularis]GIE89636.1 hypothetical protein Are01nite_61160 [Actinoplanes regularis]SNS57117.1 hypothetical protein SAMN06264365_118116 [Actinoplanes regularis]
MGIRKIRTVKLATAIPVALVVTLAAGLSVSVADVRSSTSAVAAPAGADDVKPERLKGALLTEGQLPKANWSPLLAMGDRELGSLLSSQYDAATVGGDPCALLRKAANAPQPAASGPNAPDKGRSSDLLPSIAGLGPLLNFWSEKTRAEPSHVPVAIAAFVKEGEPVSLVLQSLADLGRARSRDEVRRTERILLRCPDFHRAPITLTMTPLWMPQLGDHSVAMDYTITFAVEGDTPTSVSLYGKSLVVAYKNVSMNLVTATFDREINDAVQLRALAKTAMQNLRKANW